MAGGWNKIYNGKEVYYEEDPATFYKAPMYFFDGDGHMVTGSKTIDGKTYYFADDGHCTNF